MTEMLRQFFLLPLQTNRLTAVCAEPIVLQAAESYLTAKRNADTSEGGDASSLRNMADSGSESQSQQNWKWSGSNFVKSPTMEPWVSLASLKLRAFTHSDRASHNFGGLNCVMMWKNTFDFLEYIKKKQKKTVEI